MSPSLRYAPYSGKDIPIPLKLLLGQVERRLGSTVTLHRRVLPRGGERWYATTATEFVYLSGYSRSPENVELEARSLLWARSNDLPAPKVIELNPNWLIVERVEADATEGPCYVEQLVDVARRIRDPELSPPPPRTYGHFRGRLARVLDAPIVYGKLMRGGLNLLEYRRLHHRAINAEPKVLTHGDLQPDNTIFSRANSSVYIVDWLGLRRRPIGFDEAKAWANLKHRSDRALLVELVENSLPRASFGLQAVWAALSRLATEILAARDDLEIERRSRIVDEAREVF